MAPKYPDILTTKSWSKAKGVLGAKIKTGIGDDLKVAEADYKRIDWTKLSPKDALSRGSTMKDIELAIMAGQNEYNTKVKNLIAVVGRIANKADKAQETYKAKKAPAALIAHTTKLETAARLFSAQLQTTRADLDEIKRIASNPTVEATIGTEWYNRLERITVHNHSVLANFVKNPDLAISPADGKKSRDLADVQRRFGVELATFKKAIADLKAMKDRRMELKVAKTLVIKTWRQASDAYLVMKPGMQGIQREWGVTFTQLAKTKEAAEAWQKKYPTAESLNKGVESLLFQAEPDINALDEAVDKLERS
jgi:hypothetical protein